MRKILVVTVARSDFSIYLPTLLKLKNDKEIILEIAATGMHLSPAYGSTYKIIEKEGFTINYKLETLVSSDNPVGIGKTIGLGVISFSDLFHQSKPDIVLILGDRFDMMPVAIAALAFKIPIAHIHGGEKTMGAIDDSIRHCLTKLSHIHFATTKNHVKRILQLGENPNLVFHCGSPSIENLSTIKKISKHDFLQSLGLNEWSSFILCTFHPVTLQFEDVKIQIENFIKGIINSGQNAIITLPNADTGNYEIIETIKHFSKDNHKIKLIDSLGTERYFNAMIHADCMVGNSSSGIIEAPFFSLPVVNVGDRQKGRDRGFNVIDVNCNSKEITNAILFANTKDFKNSIIDKDNPYKSDVNASEIILNTLKQIVINQDLLMKEFVDAK
jgi:GDP/UDP-N,N'-diacetylbacillosamine 2-epimerase (hydrolysing)